jgi:hypothetical protein
MRFSLKTKKNLQLKTNFLKRESFGVMNTHDNRNYSEIDEKSTPFGIVAVSFQDTANDHILEGGDTLDEIRFLDQQFVLIIGQNYKSVSLRKCSDITLNIIFFVTENEITWSLFMGERE